MRTVVAGSRASRLHPSPSGIWWFKGWGARGILAGVTSRHVDQAAWLSHLPSGVSLVQGEQVHGSSLAVVERPRTTSLSIPGCDALLTRVPGVVLAVRSADCTPIVAQDPVRRAIGIAHVGWRGLVAGLPARLVAAFRHTFGSPPTALRIALGPAIRACCYEVSADFKPWAGAFVREQEGRLTCDLIGLVRHQLESAGVRPARITDSDLCTACHTDDWYSVRREGEATSRFVSFIFLR